MSQLLAHRRIPGEHHRRRSLELPSEESEPSEPSIEEVICVWLQDKYQHILPEIFL